MKRLFTLFLISLFSFAVQAQELSVYNQYIFNNFLMNPAVAATHSYTTVSFTGRQQWVGFEGAPRLGTLSIHSGINLGDKKKKDRLLGLGGYMYNEKSGTINRFGFLAAVAYSFPMNRTTNISFGASVAGHQFSMNQRDLTTFVENDPAIQKETELIYIVPEFNFGFYILTDNFFVGASAELNKPEINFHENGTFDSNRAKYYFFTSGYKYDINEYVVFEPSFVVKYTSDLEVDFDVNAKLYYENFWMGVSYRNKKAFMGLIGFNVERYYFGYAYEYGLNDIRDYSSGSHEILLSVRLGRLPKKTHGRGVVECPSFR